MNDRPRVFGEQATSPASGEVQPDVEQLHRPIFREPADPEEGREPAPWWLWIASALALFWGGWYFGEFGGEFGDQTHIAYRELTEYVLAEADEMREEAITDPVAAGEGIYARQCEVCHQATGEGTPGAFPPLIGSEWVTGEPETLARILLNGLQGQITVEGQVYDGLMPAWRDALSDAEVAAVGTFVRQWQANEAPPLDPALVAELRTATAGRGLVPWTADELLEVETLAPAGGSVP